MTNKLELVRTFMECMGQNAPQKQIMPTAEVLYLRYELQNEESREIADAHTLRDLLDGICDLLYVTYGTAVAAGFSSETINQAFEEVHRSNMSKLWAESELPLVPAGFASKEIVPGRYVVTNKSGKVIKSPSYQPAKLEQFITGGAR